MIRLLVEGANLGRVWNISFETVVGLDDRLRHCQCAYQQGLVRRYGLGTLNGQESRAPQYTII